MSDPTFNVRYRGRSDGPFSRDRLEEMIERGQITRLHEVSEDDGPWKRLRDRPELMPNSRSATGSVDAAPEPLDLSALEPAGEAVPVAMRMPPDDGEARWWFSLDEHKHGPVTRAKIEEVLAHNPEADGSIRVWSKGMSEWITPRQAGFRAAGSPPPPPTDAGPRRQADVSRGRSPHADAGDVRMAGFWLRLVAYAIDTFVLFVVLFVVAFAIGFLAPEQFAAHAEEIGLLFNVLGFVFSWLYFAAGESSHAGGTPGKRALGIRVTSEEGDRIGFGRASGRFFGKLISGVILCIGFLMAAIGPRHQALHDLFSRTYVIQD